MATASRVAVYAVAGLALNLSVMFVLALVWGLEGPGWEANPPDVIGSFVQIAVTLVCGGFVFFCSWFLLGVDRRDWWLGAVVGWPWLASAVAMLVLFVVARPPDAGALAIGAGLLLLAAFPIAGSIAGHRRPPRSATLSGNLVVRAAKWTWLFIRAFVRSFVEANEMR